MFPPRTEDADGALALVALEQLTRRTLRAEITARADDASRARWWLEGFVVGLCEATVERCAACEPFIDDARTQLDGMEGAVSSLLPDDDRDASRLVFALCHAINAGDEVALAWALEGQTGPTLEPATAAEVFARVNRVVIAALNLTCAAWQQYLLCRQHAGAAPA